MRRNRPSARLRASLLAVVLALVGCRAPASGEPADTFVEHVVLVWLKEPENPEHVQRMLDAARTLAAIPEVLELRAGPPLASEREVVEDGFTLGFVFRFADAAALARYEADPRHQRALREVLVPLAERFVVQDVRATRLERP